MRQLSLNADSSSKLSSSISMMARTKGTKTPQSLQQRSPRSPEHSSPNLPPNSRSSLQHRNIQTPPSSNQQQHARQQQSRHSRSPQREEERRYPVARMTVAPRRIPFLEGRRLPLVPPPQDFLEKPKMARSPTLTILRNQELQLSFEGQKTEMQQTLIKQQDSPPSLQLPQHSSNSPNSAPLNDPHEQLINLDIEPLSQDSISHQQPQDAPQQQIEEKKQQENKQINACESVPSVRERQQQQLQGQDYQLKEISQRQQKNSQRGELLSNEPHQSHQIEEKSSLQDNKPAQNQNQSFAAQYQNLQSRISKRANPLIEQSEGQKRPRPQYQDNDQRFQPKKVHLSFLRKTSQQEPLYNSLFNSEKDSFFVARNLPQQEKERDERRRIAPVRTEPVWPSVSQQQQPSSQAYYINIAEPATFIGKQRSSKKLPPPPVPQHQIERQRIRRQKSGLQLCPTFVAYQPMKFYIESNHKMVEAVLKKMNGLNTSRKTVLFEFRASSRWEWIAVLDLLACSPVRDIIMRNRQSENVDLDSFERVINGDKTPYVLAVQQLLCQYPKMLPQNASVEDILTYVLEVAGFISKMSEMDSLPSLRCCNVLCPIKTKLLCFPQLEYNRQKMKFTPVEVCSSCGQPLSLISIPEVYFLSVLSQEDNHELAKPVPTSQNHLPWGIIQKSRRRSGRMRTIKINHQNCAFVFEGERISSVTDMGQLEQLLVDPNWQNCVVALKRVKFNNEKGVLHSGREDRYIQTFRAHRHPAERREDRMREDA